MSSVPSPRVRKPKPLVRLNHLTSARSSPLSGDHDDMGSLFLHFRRMHGRRIVHRDDAECLQSAVALLDQADYAGSFESRLKPVAPQAGDVNENISHLAAIG